MLAWLCWLRSNWWTTAAVSSRWHCAHRPGQHSPQCLEDQTGPLVILLETQPKRPEQTGLDGTEFDRQVDADETDVGAQGRRHDDVGQALRIRNELYGTLTARSSNLELYFTSGLAHDGDHELFPGIHGSAGDTQDQVVGLDTCNRRG